MQCPRLLPNTSTCVVCAGLINIFSNMAWQGGPLLISVVSLGTYTLMGYPLTAAVAFPALALFNQLRCDC